MYIFGNVESLNRNNVNSVKYETETNSYLVPKFGTFCLITTKS